MFDDFVEGSIHALASLVLGFPRLPPSLSWIIFLIFFLFCFPLNNEK